MAITVLLVDDQALVRSGFGAILSTEPDIDVVGEAADGIEAIDRVGELDPDVVLMDVRMPRLDGVEATARLVAGASDRPRILMLTTFDDDELVHAALRAGASGFLLKDALPEDLANAIRVVAGGDALLAPSITRRLIDHYASGRVGGGDAPGAESPSVRAARAGVERLTDRERDVLAMMARGLSNSEIAASASVAETTVKTHVSRIFAKLGARDRAQAVIAAYEAGLATPGSS